MIAIQRFIDKFFGTIIIILLFPFKLIDKKTNGKKVLIVKLWAIGDSVLTLPMIKVLQKEGYEVHVLTRTKIKSVFDAYPVDGIIDLDKQKFEVLNYARSFDYAIDCEPYLNISAILSFFLAKNRIGFSNQLRSLIYNKKSQFKKSQHMVQNYLDLVRQLDIECNVKNLEPLQVDKEIRYKIDVFTRWFNTKKIIGITPGVAETVKSRMWFEDRFALLADRLIKEKKVKILFIDGSSNKGVVKKIMSLMKEKAVDCSGRFSLEETFELISRCDVFISNDTGPMHIAAAQGVKTIGLFGPNTPVLWGPYGEKNISIYKTKLPPSIQNDKGTFKDINRDGYMGPITVDDVYKSVEMLL